MPTPSIFDFRIQPLSFDEPDSFKQLLPRGLHPRGLQPLVDLGQVSPKQAAVVPEPDMPPAVPPAVRYPSLAAAGFVFPDGVASTRLTVTVDRCPHCNRERDDAPGAGDRRNATPARGV